MKTDRSCFARSGALVAALVLAACGAETKTGSNGTGSRPESAPFVASGTLVSAGPFATGSESLQTGATVFRIDEATDAEGANLRLGMSIEAAGTTSGTAGPAVADVREAAAQSTARGPASAIDAGAGRFSVATLAFITDANTLYDGVAGIAALAPGDFVEVHGLPLADLHTLLATRVTRVAPAANGVVTVAGRVEAYLASGGVSIAGLTVSGPAFSPTPPLGVRLRVTGALDVQASTLANPQVVPLTPYPVTANGRVELEGIALDTAAAGASFRLRTPARDYAVAAGTMVTTAVTAGARLRVVGTAASEGGIVSESVTAVGPITYRVSGTVTAFNSLQSLRVRGEPVDLTLAVIRGGSASDIANGKRLQVVGTAGPGALRVSEATILP